MTTDRTGGAPEGARSDLAEPAGLVALNMLEFVARFTRERADFVTTLYSTLHRRLAGVVGLILLGTLHAGCGTQAPTRPNVLLVIISGLRADHVSSYGYRRVTTPAVDSLATTGVLYQNALTASPWGPAAQASIETGLFQAEHGLTFERPILGESFQTLAEKLKESGYETFAVSTSSEIGQETGFGQGVDSFVGIQPEQEGSPDDGAAAAESAVTKWIEERATKTAKGPFFACAIFTNPRLPLNPPGEYRDKFIEKQIPLPRLDQLTQLWIPFARQFTLGVAELIPDEMAAFVSLYDGEVAYADYRLSRILEALGRTGDLENTLVIVTSDAGEDLGDHGLLADTSRLYDSIIRVPLVMSLPKRIKPGQRIVDQVQTVDLMRTVLALTAAPAGDGGAEGLIAPRPAAITEAHFDPGAARYYGTILPGKDLSAYQLNMVSVRTLDRKYIVTSAGTGALFDLKSDPSELKSILGEQMSAADELQGKLNAWAALLKHPAGDAAGAKTTGAAAAR